MLLLWPYSLWFQLEAFAPPTSFRTSIFKRRVALILPTLLLALAGTANAATGPTCEITFVKKGLFTEITTVVYGTAGQTGRYNSRVQTISGGNTSLSSQAGTFLLDSEGTATLGRSLIGLSSGQNVGVQVWGQYEVTQETFDCTAEK